MLCISHADHGLVTITGHVVLFSELLDNYIEIWLYCASFEATFYCT